MSSLVTAGSSRPRCQGLCVKTDKPCGISKPLNGDGFCKYHAPDALQCRGIARSTRQRCRIKWDLDGNQFCEFHGDQAANPRFPKDVTANTKKVDKLSRGEGKSKTKTKERTKPKEKAVQNKSQCYTTGERCLIKWGLNDAQLCEYHKYYSPVFAKTPVSEATARRTIPMIRAVAVVTPTAKASQCRGTAASTGCRCRIKWHLNARGYCKYHVNQ